MFTRRFFPFSIIHVFHRPYDILSLRGALQSNLISFASRGILPISYSTVYLTYFLVRSRAGLCS